MLNGSSPTLEDVRRVLEIDGKHAVLLPIKAREKGPKLTGWPDITYADTLSPAYQELLKSYPNTGVNLGNKSSNLEVFDLDTDAGAEAFLQLNPRFRDTLTSRGQRGKAFWAYVTGERPHKIHPLKVRKGSPLAVGAKEDPDKNDMVQIGEYRAEGGQQVIRGRHECGLDYTWLVDTPPITINWEDIRWPNDIATPWENQRDTSDRTPLEGSLLKRAIAAISVEWLWGYFSFPAREGKNPVCSPFREEARASFSIYDEGRRFKDHGNGDRGDSYNFYQLATGKDSGSAFVPFVELAGLADELQERSHLRGSQTTANGTAGQHDGSNAEKPDVILPSGDIEFSDTARAMFPTLGQRHRYFVRGRALVEIAFQKLLKDKQLHDIFQLLDPDAFRSRIEQDFECKVWREQNGKHVLKRGRLTHDCAKVLLKTDEAFEFLPHVATLCARPVLVGPPGKLEILYKGYHDVHGGIYVSHGESQLPMSDLATAQRLLLEAIVDFDFVSEADKARAIAAFISPALRPGKLLGEGVDFPIDIGEADESQSGKTFRQKLVCAVHGETPYVIANRQGGVGSLDESISSALLAGLLFILFENFRGQMRSQLVETCLRGTGIAPARAPHKGEIQVPTEHINWQLSSNGLDATRDFANRSSIIRICKQPPGHKFRKYPEGNILAHIKANQPLYQAAVFRIIMEWDRAGRPHTDETRHDFLESTQALDWMAQEIFGFCPLMDGHVEEILRVSNPALSWLRSVAIACEKQKRLDEALSASEIVDICQGCGLELPGASPSLNPDQLSMCVGRLLNRIFHDAEKVNVDRFNVRRESSQERNENRVLWTKHVYWFGKR